MKFITVLILLLPSPFAICQETYPDCKDFKSIVLRPYNFIYSSFNSDDYFAKAKSLLLLNNSDSSNKAIKIMWGLSLFDSVKYSTESLRPIILKTIKSNISSFSTTLIGCWRFSHDFWTGIVSKVTTTTEIDSPLVIKFNGKQACFYINDSLIRKTEYTIQSKQTDCLFQDANSYFISFADMKERWYFSMNLDWLKPILIINITPDCSCGCRQDIYKKISNSYL